MKEQIHKKDDDDTDAIIPEALEAETEIAEEVVASPAQVARRPTRVRHRIRPFEVQSSYSEDFDAQ